MTYSPLPNFSAALAKFTIGRVWFFKKTIAIKIKRKPGRVIHNAKILAEEGAILSLGNIILRIPFLYLILKSTAFLNVVVSNQ